MGRGNRNPGCVCCETTGCPEFTDDFDRANSTNVGANWTESAGDWSISSNKITTTDTDARLIYAGATIHIDQIVSVKIKGATNDKGGIITSWVDSNNYMFTEVEFGVSLSTIRVFEVRGGTSTQKGITTHQTPGIISATEETLKVCYYSPTRMHSWFTGDGTDNLRSMEQIFLTTPPNGELWGLGTGGTNSGVTFDDVSFKRHHP